MVDSQSKFSYTYENYEKLQSRKNNSSEKLTAIKEEFDKESIFKENNISVFAAGSLGRSEYGKKSDLDIFIISHNTCIKRLDEIKIFNQLICINNRLGFDDFSNDGQFLKIYKLEDLKTKIGSQNEDAENIFTTRMLLLLESKPLCNKEIYLDQIKEIIAYYYRDHQGKKNFKPLFLLNDILRFWRTLCLNYEYTRRDKGRFWKKKNFNLKYSRMLTVFSTVLYIISTPIPTQEDLFDLFQISPLERLSRGLDKLDSNQLSIDKYLDFLQNYEYFLCAKETSDLNQTEDKDVLNQKALECSRFIFSALNDSKIELQYRQYLVI